MFWLMLSKFLAAKAKMRICENLYCLDLSCSLLLHCISLKQPYDLKNKIHTDSLWHIYNTS